jgi:hypothetical protein
MEPQIRNREQLRLLVGEGQEIFKRLKVTCHQMKTAQENVKEFLANEEQTIVEKWKSAIKGTPLDNETTPCVDRWLQWLYLYTETVIYEGQANPKWMDSTRASLLRLEEELCEIHAEINFDELATAVKDRIAATRASYKNPFTNLYSILGTKADEFKKFEETLKDVVPIFETAPEEVPSGIGRNARIGAASCVDVVLKIILGELEYVGVITSRDDEGAWKLLGGKREPHYSVAFDGTLCVAMDNAKDTAVKEFLEESGADRVSKPWFLDEAHLQLLRLHVSDWKERLREMECVVDGNKVTWSKKARDEVETYVKGGLSERISNVIVPDIRATKNAGYITTLYELPVVTSNKRITALFLALPGGSDAQDFTLRPASTVAEKIQSTHKSIFQKYRQVIDSPLHLGSIS